MPSRFEPCGLSQMYAQKFGSLPIGHQTGGLAETITDGETGFLFSQPSTESFLGGIRRAFSTFMAKDRLELDAPQRDVAILQLGCFGGLLRRALSENGVAVESAITDVRGFLLRAPPRFRHHQPDHERGPPPQRRQAR